MPEPLIRRARPDEAQTLAAIGEATFIETFGHLYPAADLARYLAQAYGLARTQADLADPAIASWLVEADGEVVGYATAGPCTLPHAEITSGCGELKRIYLSKAVQGGGLAERLLVETVAWMERNGPCAVWLGVWSQNHRALRFYERQGFRKVGDYDFRVGNTVDHEYIFRRDPVYSSGRAVAATSSERNRA